MGVLEQGLARLWTGFVDTVTPPHCLSCHAEISQASSLCIACWKGLKLIDEPVCNALGTPFAYSQGDGALSAAALANPPIWDRARAAVAYDDGSRPIVHALKYRDTQEAGLMMARLMALAGRRLLEDADLLVPVPLHRLRLWRRRFNQSAFLAKEISRLSGVPWQSDLILRVRRTRPQVGLREDERRRNVGQAFRVSQKVQDLAGRKLVIIDDVMTTGATASACAKVLRKAGAARVDVICFALVLEPSRIHI